jgi:hypothetical protein
MFIRISDNVFDLSMWTIGRIAFGPHGRVATQELIHDGVYGLPNCIGWTLAELVEWQNFDPTGQHPETYCEVSRDGRKWEFLLSESEVLAMTR